jgi:hypothetical protein
MLLVQAGKDPVHENISGVGLFTFPPEEPVEIKDDHLGSVLLDRLAYAALTQVPETRVKGIPQYDIAAAIKTSQERLKIERKKLVERYINNQLETRVRQNLPPLPPAPAVQKIIEQDEWDLATYGIHPVGWKLEERKQEINARMDNLEKANVALQDQNKILQELNKALIEKVDALTDKIDKKGK